MSGVEEPPVPKVDPPVVVVTAPVVGTATPSSSLQDNNGGTTKNTPVVMAAAARGVRVTAPAIIATNLIQHQGAVFKTAPNNTSTSVIARSIAPGTYHVPRGPAISANLAAAPRPNRSPTTILTQGGVVVTPSPAPTNMAAIIRPSVGKPTNNPAWLAAASSVVTAKPTVLNPMIKQANLVGGVKGAAPIIYTQAQQVIKPSPSGALRASTAGAIINLSQNAAPIKVGAATTTNSSNTAAQAAAAAAAAAAAIQAVGTTVTIAQIVPRTQSGGGTGAGTVVYTAGTVQFNQTPRFTASNAQNRSPTTIRPLGQVATARLISPQAATVLTSARVLTPPSSVNNGTNINNTSSNNNTSGTTNRTITGGGGGTQPIGRLAMTPNPVQVAATLTPPGGGARTLNLHSLVAVNNNSTVGQRATPIALNKVAGGGGAAPAQIHFTPITVGAPKTMVTSGVVMTPAVGNRNIPPPIGQRSTQNVSLANIYTAQTPTEVGPQNGAPANVFIHAPIAGPVRKTANTASSSNAATIAQQSLVSGNGTNNPSSVVTPVTTVATYSLASGTTTYYYDNSGPSVNFPSHTNRQQFNPSSVTFTTLTPSVRPITTTATAINTGARLVPAPTAIGPPAQNTTTTLLIEHASAMGPDLSQPPPPPQLQQTTVKSTSSPRPSILRKRDHDGGQLKAAKNLTTVLAALPPISPPSRPDSRGNGHSSSGGSTTMSATSSPGGIGDGNEDSMPSMVPMNNNSNGNGNENSCTKEPIEETNNSTSCKPPMEMSPRKKPRKQQLTGNSDLMTAHNDDIQFLTDTGLGLKKEYLRTDGIIESVMDVDGDGTATIPHINNDSNDINGDMVPPTTGTSTTDSTPPPSSATVRKPATACLLNAYRQTWKATHNHYLRYSDVRPKDERRPTIMDLANQYRVQEKINGWKIYHLSTQMEDLADQEQCVYNQLTDLLKCTESFENGNFSKDVNRVNELIKGNLQRIKIINDGMLDAKTQIMKIFDHKVHVTDIVSRCASKRNYKKREKL